MPDIGKCARLVCSSPDGDRIADILAGPSRAHFLTHAPQQSEPSLDHRIPNSKRLVPAPTGQAYAVCVQIRGLRALEEEAGIQAKLMEPIHNVGSLDRPGQPGCLPRNRLAFEGSQ